MIPINCPACGARMRMEAYDLGRWAAWYVCPTCELHGSSMGAATHRGAAIRAGRAMRRIVEAIQDRARRQYASVFRAARDTAFRDHAQRVLLLLHDHKLTRAQITERMRQEVAQ